MEYFYPLIGKCALTKPEEQGGGRQIPYREPGEAAEPGQRGDNGDFLQQPAGADGRGSFGWLCRAGAVLIPWKSQS